MHLQPEIGGRRKEGTGERSRGKERTRRCTHKTASYGSRSVRSKEVSWGQDWKGCMWSMQAGTLSYGYRADGELQGSAGLQ